MAQQIGMSPERVEHVATRLNAAAASLGGARDQLTTAVRASLSPPPSGVRPGDLIIAPWAIAGCTVAAMNILLALRSIESLQQHLLAEAREQRGVSASVPGITAKRVSGGISTVIAKAIAKDVDALSSFSPAQVSEWWGSLAPAARRALIEKHPDTIGNAEGIPYTDRDTANRLYLETELTRPWWEPGADRKALQAVDAALEDARRRGVTAQLITLDFPRGADPRAAIAYGDLDTAAYIGMVIPGMGNTVTKDMQKLGTAAYNLYTEQADLLSWYGERGQPAVIAWMGYQTPGAAPNPAVLHEDRAIRGAVYLKQALSGLNSPRDDALLSLFPHSYATRTVTYALSTGGMADRLVMLGSPGIAETVDHVSDLAVPPEQVYATRAAKDITALLGILGSQHFGDENIDPLNPSFGSRVFSSDGTTITERVDDHDMLLSEETNGEKHGYMDIKSDSLRDMALIGVGHEKEIQ